MCLCLFVCLCLCVTADCAETRTTLHGGGAARDRRRTERPAAAQWSPAMLAFGAFGLDALQVCGARDAGDDRLSTRRADDDDLSAFGVVCVSRCAWRAVVGAANVAVALSTVSRAGGRRRRRDGGRCEHCSVDRPESIGVVVVVVVEFDKREWLDDDRDDHE